MIFGFSSMPFDLCGLHAVRSALGAFATALFLWGSLQASLR
jgi:hypothetical protein